MAAKKKPAPPPSVIYPFKNFLKFQPTNINSILYFQPIRSPTPIQHESSEHAPSAKGSHHVEDQPAPAIPISFLTKNFISASLSFSITNNLTLFPFQALADMFSFDIRQFMDDEEETSSKAQTPLADGLKDTLKDIAHRLESSLEALVVDCGPIRARFGEIQDQIPDDVVEVISPAVFLEQYQFKFVET